MRLPAGLFLVSAAVILAAWWWLGMPAQMPPAPVNPGEKLHCLSYAPFRARQTPLNESTRIDPKQIEEDLQRLAGVTRCVRTYSVDFGLENVPGIARRYGLKVLQGLWVSNNVEKTQFQISAAVDLAKRYPDVIEAIIVGNEVLLRGDMSAADLANTIRAVKAQVRVPVTYADVWEFWLRNPAVLDAVDFVTIHILPYWEDFPIPVAQAAAHVVAIRQKVAAALPGKEILIGETGWPSAGRMREGALPSPVNQAAVIHEVLTAAKRENFHVNIVEAFDQPWKRQQEGTVGGYWGLFDAYSREAKFAWGGLVSNHPFWRWQAAGGMALAFLTYAAAFAAARRSGASTGTMRQTWIGAAAIALPAGMLVGWSIENAMIESLDAGGWILSLALVAVSIAAPTVAAAALASGVSIASFSQVFAPPKDRLRQPLGLALGVILIVVSVLALQFALALVFEPRYRNFAFAPLTSALVPFLVLAFTARSSGAWQAAETVLASVLLACAAYIVPNEGFANWQALWFCAALLVLAVILLRVRDAPD